VKNFVDSKGNPEGSVRERECRLLFNGGANSDKFHKTVEIVLVECQGAAQFIVVNLVSSYESFS